jgi:hypothetical protein
MESLTPVLGVCEGSVRLESIKGSVPDIDCFPQAKEKTVTPRNKTQFAPDGIRFFSTADLSIMPYFSLLDLAWRVRDQDVYRKERFHP